MNIAPAIVEHPWKDAVAAHKCLAKGQNNQVTERANGISLFILYSAFLLTIEMSNSQCDRPSLQKWTVVSIGHDFVETIFVTVLFPL